MSYLFTLCNIDLGLKVKKTQRRRDAENTFCFSASLRLSVSAFFPLSKTYKTFMIGCVS